MAGTKASNRAKTRTLVRWSDDHDKELLLWIQFCCNEGGVKIPFARVAQCMGPSFSEGAIVQHLAKIRTKMEDAGLHVPPAQKRGTVTRAASSIYKPKAKTLNMPVPRARPDSQGLRGKIVDDDEEDEEEESVEPSDISNQPNPRKYVRRQNNTRKTSVTIKQESDDDDPHKNLVEELYDSDNEYGAKKPRASRKKAATQGADGGSRRLVLKTNLPTQLAQRYAKAADTADTSFQSLTSPDYGVPGTSDDLTFRGIRRKNPDAAAEQGNVDHDGAFASQEGTGITKGRPSRLVKKQKTAHGNDAPTGHNTGSTGTVSGHRGFAQYTSDSMAMPPPSLPRTGGDFGYTWDDGFGQHALNDSSLPETGDSFVHVNPGTTAAPLPADVNGFSPDFGSDDQYVPVFAPTFPSYQHGPAFSFPAMSGANTRNNSFASIDSNSTIESQPTSWQQPLRSPGFPNPQEASHVLHQAMHTPGADETTFVNVFNTLGHRNGSNGVNDQTDGDGGIKTDIEEQRSSTQDQSSDLFVGGLPEEDTDHIDYDAFLNNDAFAF